MELSERCIQTLEKEGFLHVFEWKSERGTISKEHAHQGKVTIFVTEGQLALTIAGDTHDLKAGDRFNIPPYVSHHTVAGPNGCQYVVGEMIHRNPH